LKQIHLIAPSGASPEQNSPLAGIDWLGQQGIEILNTACINRIDQRFAGSDAERLAEINQLSQLKPETLVMSMRGGYGIHRLLPGIEWQALAKSIGDGLQLCGHSDFTTLQLALLAKTEAITLSGPMLNYDFGRLDDDGKALSPDEFTWKHFQAAVDDRFLDCEIKAVQHYLGQSNSGRLSGLLWGGNLTILAGLIATRYLPSLDQTEGGILFLEDVNEHPYRVERMLVHLLDAGILENQAAILLGGFSGYRLYEIDRGYDLNSAIEYIRTRIPAHIPVLTDLPFGHQAQKLTLPIGAQAQIDFDQAGFHIQSKW
jgi:muramoyltetrapeptide carboxypeptidase